MKTKLSIFTSLFSLLILVATIFIIFNIFSFSDRLKEKTEILVYLKNSADTVTLQKDIAALREVKKVRFISKDEALKAFKKDMGKDEDIFSVLQTNPLPDSFRVRIKASHVTINEFEKICSKLRDFAGVAEVRYEKEFLTRLSRILKIMELTGSIGGGIIAGYSLLVFITLKRLTG